MNRPLTAFVVFLALTLGAAAEFADYVYLSPSAKSLAGEEQARYPLPRTEALRLLALDRPVRTLSGFAGKNAELRGKSADAGAFRVAEGEAVAWDAAGLFGPGRGEGGRFWFTAEVGSTGALAVRLRVDVSGFGPDDALYCMDVEGGRTHGPYTRRDASEGGLWLPTIAGDHAVLALSSPGAALPPLHIEALSHFFAFYAEKAGGEEFCPIPADCETDPAAFEVSTSAGLLIVPQFLGQVQCTGTLLNRAGTPNLDPLFVTARHCFDSRVRARDVDVFWDYRTGGCDPALPKPALSTLPRSSGRELLAHSAAIDGQFLLLDGAPVGAFGRAWAGWDTAVPGLGAAVQGFHCPAGTPLKTCRGVVLEINREECLNLLCTTKYEKQTRIRWNEGITEGGSSGSGLFTLDGAFRLIGMLSNGTVHTCGRPASNLDNYSSFRDFFPYIACHLVDGAGCIPGDKDSWCFLGKMVGSSGPAAEGLRHFRDTVLMPLPLGKKVVAAYYAASPALERAAEASPAFRAVSAVCAAGAALLPAPPGD